MSRPSCPIISQITHQQRLRLLLGLVAAVCELSGQPPPSVPVPAPVGIPVPLTTPAPEPGRSGPGARFSLDGTVYRQRVNPNSTVVRNGLLPPLQPLIDLHIRDTIIRPGGDGYYYLTGSTGADIWHQNTTGIELWRSTDLQTWDYLGVVWNLAREGTWEPQHVTGTKYARTLWAPEIVYIKRLKNYFLTYSMPPGDRGILKSSTGKPEGPYVNALADNGKLAGEIDLSLFEDDDGTVYATWGPAYIARMKDDLSGLAEERHNPELLHPDLDPTHHATTSITRGYKDIGHEGPCLFKRNGKYYLTAADTYLGRYSSLVAVSDHVYGPYDLRHEAVPGGGGGDYFQDNAGSWWCTYFGNDGAAPFREMPALVKVEFDADGKIHVAKTQPDFVLLESARYGRSPWSAKPATPAPAVP